MMHLEDELRQMLRERAAQSTTITHVDVSGVRRRRVRWGLVAPALGIVVAAAVVAIVAIVQPHTGSPQSSNVATEGDTHPSVEGLTPDQLVEMFDLQPVTAPTEQTDCHRFVGADSVGYCLDHLDVDDWTEEHIAAQLMGYEDNQALHDYVDAVVAYKELKAEDPNSAQLDALGRDVLDAQQRLTKASP